MPLNDILETVRGIMEDVFDTDIPSIDPRTTADDIEDWDSLSHVRLMVAIERRYRFKFTNAEVESMQNVGDLVKIIRTKTA
jgi:acyl carrier protein